MSVKGWLGAVEGYYGPPLAHAERIELVRWLGAHGFNAYGYAPKDDPYHRERWREPYPPDREAEFKELVSEGTAAGIDVALVVSPGLDWKPGEDDAALTRKLESFAALGARTLGVAFDDVAPGGAQLGAAHAAGIASAVRGIDARWITCPTDYATDHATAYLRAYCDGLPDGVDVMWTGPSIVSPRVDGAMARALAKDLGRPMLFAENYPVNDGAMQGALHLGPYRGRAPDLPASCSGVFFNFMSRARASRLGLACGARFWLDPTADTEQTWSELLTAEFEALAPLARASRTWALDPAPDERIAGMVQQAIEGDPAPLNAYLDAGCRAGLEETLSDEIAPWLDQWETERLAMQCAIWLLNLDPEHHASATFALAETWARARASRLQLFGTRGVHYPLTTRRDDMQTALAEGFMFGENLTDRLAKAAIERLSPQA